MFDVCTSVFFYFPVGRTAKYIYKSKQYSLKQFDANLRAISYT